MHRGNNFKFFRTNAKTTNVIESDRIKVRLYIASHIMKGLLSSSVIYLVVINHLENTF